MYPENVYVCPAITLISVIAVVEKPELDVAEFVICSDAVPI